jgi:crotonobetainyl-CoA:carnitine CoA-transferase CaiB-like acyl-CoA transferase
VTFLPLEGVRALDLTSSLAGPYCTEILGALGADVVKIEHPQRGDEARVWGPSFFPGGSALFFAANAGKRSLALDLKTAAGKDALLRLVDGADVLLQSMRPGAAERLGLGAGVVHARNPPLVYCSIGAYGRRGPLRDLPGYDPLMQAHAGRISVTGEPNRPGVRVGASVVDQTTGMWAALAIVAALRERDATGRGREVDVSLYETALALVPYHLAEAVASGQAPGRHGTAFPVIVPYQVFATSDRELMIAAGNDGLFARLCAGLGLPELARDARFATNPLRVRHRDKLIPLLERRLAEEPSAVWVERLRAGGIPGCARPGPRPGRRGRADPRPWDPPGARWSDCRRPAARRRRRPGVVPLAAAASRRAVRRGSPRGRLRGRRVRDVFRGWPQLLPADPW